MFYRSVMTYREMADNMDFIKPILYHDIAGPRTRSMYDTNVEPKLDELNSKGLGPDYVYRETKRCVQSVEGRTKIYAGIGIDIPGNNQTFSSNPEGVYQATRKAFEAGAAGVLISREYDEMRMPNLRAVGRAVKDLPKDAV
jgi:hypothetical protein